jgi:aspartyl protease family protein
MDKETLQQRKISRIMIIGMWALLIVMLSMYFNKILEDDNNPNQQVNSSQTSDGIRQVILQRNNNGHYVATGKINNQPVTFFLDTGATDISIPQNIADRIGLIKGQPVIYSTANGPAKNYLTKLDSVSLGNIRLSNLRASINPNIDSDEILLGMSFLKHLEFTQKGKTLTIRQ